MFGLELLDLKRENDRKFYYNKIIIQRLIKEIEEFIAEEAFLDDLNTTPKTLPIPGIKINVSNDELVDSDDNIEDLISKEIRYGKDKNQIINFYYSYRYILLHKDINKESIRKLYSILSKNSLEEMAKNNMGKYYRTSDVIILDNPSSKYLSGFEKGLSPKKIEQAMDDLFQFIMEDSPKQGLNTFIKSQIIHFYFFYIHPYYDVNSRMASIVSQWYLIREKAYPFTIFNKGISYHRDMFHRSTKKSRRGNITPFLKYILITLKEELEKEKIIYNIRNSSESSLTKEEYSFLEYILSIKTHRLEDIIKIYEKINYPAKGGKLLLEIIYPLIEKGILVLNEEEQTLKINKKFITIEKRKADKLRIKSYIAE